MSRVAKEPVAIPGGVEINFAEGVVRVKGPNGELSQALHETVDMAQEDGSVSFKAKSDDAWAMM